MFDSLKIIFRRFHWWLPFARTKYTGEVVGQRVLMDYTELRNAKFVDCELVYGGGTMLAVDCSMDRCSWSVIGKAANSVAYLKAVNEMPGGRDLIEKTFPAPIAPLFTKPEGMA